MDKILLEAKAVTLGAIYNRLNLSEDEFDLINKDTNLRELVKDNPYVLGHILMDIHEMLDINTIDFKENSEFEHFETVEDMIRYFVGKLKE